MAISIQYNLTGRGWSECIVEIDDQQVHLKASYLLNALAHLLDAVAAVVRGADEATASFANEPGECRWRFKSHLLLRGRLIMTSSHQLRQPLLLQDCLTIRVTLGI